jgi:hypothetical protein
MHPARFVVAGDNAHDALAIEWVEKEDSDWSLFEKSSKCIGMPEWIVSLGERIDIWTDHFHAAEPRSVTIDAPSMEIGIER